MSKYDRWRGSGGAHGGYSETPTVPQAAKLDGLMADFKAWFSSMAGFGEYLRTFYSHYEEAFAAHVEEHSLLYTQLHQEFSRNLEQCIDQWLAARGISEDDFGDMMRLARSRGDEQSDSIIGVLLGMLDYHLWIRSIFALRQSSQTQTVTTPDGQTLLVSVPPGAVPGESFSVTYTRLASGA
mmetsp:Transcript_16735/g.36712  ORF Transcript_16735/g.36712 Transcript_16735/m.36712 type:complete len:182 (+) Transcript_16735:82-627(+)